MFSPPLISGAAGRWFVPWFFVLNELRRLKPFCFRMFFSLPVLVFHDFFGEKCPELFEGRSFFFFFVDFRHFGAVLRQ